MGLMLFGSLKGSLVLPHGRSHVTSLSSKVLTLQRNVCLLIHFPIDFVNKY